MHEWNYDSWQSGTLWLLGSTASPWCPSWKVSHSTSFHTGSPYYTEWYCQWTCPKDRTRTPSFPQSVTSVLSKQPFSLVWFSPWWVSARQTETRPSWPCRARTWIGTPHNPTLTISCCSGCPFWGWWVGSWLRRRIGIASGARFLVPSLANGVLSGFWPGLCR